MTITALTKSAPLKAVALATVIAVSAPATAFAGGSFQVSIQGHNSDSNNAIRTGLALFGVANQMKKGGFIKQKGHHNSAGVAQNGHNNTGIVYQEGNGHNGTLKQNGHNNSHGLFQFGRNTNTHVQQNGNGNAGATFVFGF